MSDSNSVDIQRYSRQLLLPKWSLATQTALAKQKILIAPQYELALLYALAGGVTKVCLTGSLNPGFLAHCTQFQSKLSIASLELPLEPSTNDWQVCLLPFSVWEQGLIEPSNAQSVYLLKRSSIYHSKCGITLLNKMNICSPMLESAPPALWQELASCLAIADYFAHFANL